jgi:hypothetical protein
MPPIIQIRTTHFESALLFTWHLENADTASSNSYSWAGVASTSPPCLPLTSISAFSNKFNPTAPSSSPHYSRQTPLSKYDPSDSPPQAPFSRPGTVSRNITHSLPSHGQCLGPLISGPLRCTCESELTNRLSFNIAYLSHAIWMTLAKLCRWEIAQATGGQGARSWRPRFRGEL